jgi:excisionase family DNA binding protein
MARELDDRARDEECLVEGAHTEGKVSLASPPWETIEPFTLSIKDVGRLLGIGRSTVYRLIGDGQLSTIKIGNRTLIRTTSIRCLLESQG